MHRALLLPEILECIFGHFAPRDARDRRQEGRAELAALSVVSRAFSAQALDLIWASVDPLPLMKLIPPDTLDSPGHAASLADRLSNMRFFHYSQRVCTLIWPNRSGQHVDHAVLHVWQRDETRLFPKLHGLDLDFRGSDAECAQIMWNMILPRISELRLRITNSVAASLDNDALRSLADGCAGITRFASYIRNVETTTQKRVVSSLLIGSARLRHVHCPHNLTDEAVLHLAAVPHLRTMQIDVKSTADSWADLLPDTIFQSMERPYIHEDAAEAPFICRLLAAKRHTPTLRDVRLTASASPATWVDISRRLGSQRSLVSLYFDYSWRLPGLPPDEPRVRFVDIVDPLSDLPLLETIHLSRDRRTGPWDRVLPIPQPGLLRFTARWPRLRWCTVPTSDISCDSFFQILELCPQLQGLSTTIVCSSLPSEEAVARAEALHHPFTGGNGLLVDAATNLGEAMRVLRRAVPHAMSSIILPIRSPSMIFPNGTQA